jgi:transcription initiation factor TFIIB
MTDRNTKTRSGNARKPTESTAEKATHSSSNEATAERDTCPDCESNLIQEDGDRYCPDCGFVDDSPDIDHGPEWRAFNSTEREQKSRVGSPLTETLHDRGLSTKIGWDSTDAYGNPLSNDKRRRLARLREHDTWAKSDNKDRGLKAGFTEIKRMSSALGLADSTTEIASRLYRKASNDGFLPGRSVEAVASASLLIAARMSNTPRSYSDVAHVSRIGRDEIISAVNGLNRKYSLPLAPVDPAEYVPQYASKLGVSTKIERKAADYTESMKEATEFQSRAPTTLAATALYIAALKQGQMFTQEAVSQITDVSPVTLRKVGTDLLKHDDSIALTDEEIDDLKITTIADQLVDGDIKRADPE